MKNLNSKSNRLEIRNNEINRLVEKFDAAVIVFHSLTFAVYTDEKLGKSYVKSWTGTSCKPVFYSFRNIDSAMAYVLRCKESEQERAEWKAAKKSTANSLKVGDVLYTSWGYEQTNVEFLEVVALVGSTMVEVREINAASVSGSESFMSDCVVPCKGQFRGESVRVRVTNGNSFNWGGSYKRRASLYNHGTTGVHRSWYA